MTHGNQRYPSGGSTPPLSTADTAAHVAASYVRPSVNETVCTECNGSWYPGHVCPRRVAALAQDYRRALAADAVLQILGGAS